MFIKQLEYDVMGSPRKELTQFYGNLEGSLREVISERSSKERVEISQAESRWGQAERVAHAEPRGWVTWHSLGAVEVLCGRSTGRVLGISGRQGSVSRDEAGEVNRPHPHSVKGPSIRAWTPGVEATLRSVHHRHPGLYSVRLQKKSWPQSIFSGLSHCSIMKGL